MSVGWGGFVCVCVAFVSVWSLMVLCALHGLICLFNACESFMRIRFLFVFDLMSNIERYVFVYE